LKDKTARQVIACRAVLFLTEAPHRDEMSLSGLFLAVLRE